MIALNLLRSLRNCTGCGLQPRGEFHAHPGGLDGLASRCKACKAQRFRAWCEKNPDASRERGRAWRSDNVDRWKAYNRLSRYGVSRDDFEDMLWTQAGLCAVCCEPMTPGFDTCVDHDHETGRVRGLLHRNCNSAIGLLRENPSAAWGALIYLSSL